MQKYFDQREQRWKVVPKCGDYGLVWNAVSERCHYPDPLDSLMNLLSETEEYYPGQYLSDSYDGQMGYLPSGGGTASSAGISSALPIVGIVDGIVGAIGGLIGSARQRGTDEARSGVALQMSVDGIFYLRDSVMDGDITVKQARDIFRSQILPAFLSFIATLQTKSVVESRLTNQKRDLENLFEDQVGKLQDVVKPPVAQPATPSSSPSQTTEDDSTIEYYGDDGSYYYEDENGWYYEDSSGDWQQADNEGNLYAGNDATGEYWYTDSSGESYWESGDGSFYLEDSQGNWTSGDAAGSKCSGDLTGAWECEDGTSGNDWHASPARIPKQQGQTRRQQQIPQSNYDKLIKQAISLIPLATRKTQNAQRAQTGRAQTQAINAQERLRNLSPNQGSSSGSMKGLLIIGAIGLGAYFLLNRG